MEIINNKAVQVTETTNMKTSRWKRCASCHKHLVFRQKKYRIRWRPNWFWSHTYCGRCFTHQMMIQPAYYKKILKRIQY